jgi:hypothetical protein
MSAPHTARGDLFAAVSALFVFALFTGLFLALEEQWEIAALALLAAAGLYAAGRSGLAARIQSVGAAHPRTAPAAVALALLAVIAVLHQSHFALLMLATVALYATACMGLTVQFGYAGLTNFAGAAFFGIGGYATAMLATHSGRYRLAADPADTAHPRSLHRADHDRLRDPVQDFPRSQRRSWRPPGPEGPRPGDPRLGIQPAHRIR